MSMLRVLQMRCTYVHDGGALVPEMTPFIALELGRTVEDAPDVWAFLNTFYMRQPYYEGDDWQTPKRTYTETETKSRTIDVKNFERWLYQRDAVGYETTPDMPIKQAIKMWMIAKDKYTDHIARTGKKIGFDIDDRWLAIDDSLAIKVTYFDNYSGEVNLVYHNGTAETKIPQTLLGDSKLKTVTFFIPKIKANSLPNNFDFALEAGASTEKIVISMVRVVQAKQGIVSTTRNIVASAVNGTVSLSPAGGEYELGTTIALTATPADAYKFVNWTDANNAIFTANPYTFKVASNRKLTANFTPVTAIKDVETDANKSVFIYPNPVTDVLNIEHVQDATIRIYDMRGALLYYAKSSGRKTTVDVTKFKKSKMLLLHVISENNSEFVKIIVE